MDTPSSDPYLPPAPWRCCVAGGASKKQEGAYRYTIINDMPCCTVDVSNDDSFSRRLQLGDRTVGYGLALAREETHRRTAVVYFYPIGGSSSTVRYMSPSLSDYRCSLLCVDRPGRGDTSQLPEPSPCGKDDLFIRRIRGHVDDVLAVLRHERIRRAFVLGVCLGHPYAIELCRRLCSVDRSNDAASSETPDIELAGLTLVAPFVGTAAPDSWRVARLGAAVPSSVLYGFTETAAALSPWIVRTFMRPSAVQKIVTEDEQREFGWIDPDDFEQAAAIAIEMNRSTRGFMAVEARLGASPEWQDICDKFAIEGGFGLKTDSSSDDGGAMGVFGADRSPCVHVRIHACENDKLVSLPSVVWLAERCYGGTEAVVLEPRIRSHEVMTFFGGPPRNPVLLHEIAQAWGLLDSVPSGAAN